MAEQIANESLTVMENRGPGPDAHGHAAMLLVESLIHTLVARSLISVADAVEIVSSAMDVNDEFAADAALAPATTRHARALLDAIKTSLSIDLPTDPDA